METLRNLLSRGQLPLAVIAFGIAVAIVVDVAKTGGGSVEMLLGLAASTGIAGALGLPRPSDERRK